VTPPQSTIGHHSHAHDHCVDKDDGLLSINIIPEGLRSSQADIARMQQQRQLLRQQQEQQHQQKLQQQKEINVGVRAVLCMSSRYESLFDSIDTGLAMSFMFARLLSLCLFLRLSTQTQCGQL